MEKKEAGINPEKNRASSKTGWEGVEKMAGKFEQKRTPECRRNSDGDVMFSRIGDEIVFGETPYTRRVDALPWENREDYDSSVIGIETNDGNCYYIAEGLLVDRKNDKKVDLIRKRGENANYSFPSIRIGYRLPFEKISENLKVPDGEKGSVLKIVSYGEAPSAHGQGSEMKKQIQGVIHEMIMGNDAAKQARNIQH